MSPGLSTEKEEKRAAPLLETSIGSHASIDMGQVGPPRTVRYQEMNVQQGKSPFKARQKITIGQSMLSEAAQ